MNGAGDGVFGDPGHPSAQGGDGAGGLLHLLVGGRALQGQELPAHLHQRQAQLAQNVQPGHGPGDRQIILLPVTGGVFLRPGGHHLGLHPQTGEHLPQPVHALLQAVQQGHTGGWLGNGHGDAGESGAAAHIHNGLAFTVRCPQHRQRVQKMQLSHGLRLRDGRQVHDLVLFQQQPSEFAQAVRLLPGQGLTGLGQTGFQRRPHQQSFAMTARKTAGASVWLRMAWVCPSAQNSASPGCRTRSSPSSATVAEPESR